MSASRRRVFSRFYVWLVVLIWIAAMSWLIVVKVLPPLLVGEPPTLQRVIGPDRESPPCGWKVELGNRRIGWSLSQVVSKFSEVALNKQDVTEIRSQTRFEDVSLARDFPMMKGLTQWIAGSEALTQFSLRASNTVVIDPLGRLIRFDSDLELLPYYIKFKLSGVVMGEKMKLMLNFGETRMVHNVPVSPHSLIGDRFSPQMHLPGLRKNQAWTVPVHNPISLSTPVEFLQAKVEGKTPLKWNGKEESVWMVTFHEDAGSGLGGKKQLQGRLWVREDGTVLQNEMRVMDTPITFVRFTEKETASLMKKLGIEEL